MSDHTFTRTDTYPARAPIKKWVGLSGMNRTATFEALKRGDLQAVKLGKATLIDVPAGLAWLSSLPAAGSKKAA